MDDIDHTASRPRRILPVIVLSQFAGTSLWFATNAILPDVQSMWHESSSAIGWMTSAIQLGFILGTLVSAFLNLPDRFSPRVVFCLSSLLGAMFNLGIIMFVESWTLVLLLRVLTGVCLAGIYPVGMKIASGWYRQGLGHALGFLVGALVLGSAFPHLLKGDAHNFEWQSVLITVSGLAALGGVLMFFLVPNGPYLVRGTRFDPVALRTIFRSRNLRASAFGYFGHMWELYALYAFVPFILAAYASARPEAAIDVATWSFITIGSGAIACVLGGFLSLRIGSAPVAWTQLLISGLFCCCSPLLFSMPPIIFLSSLVVWGMVVVGDSPQFSSLIAQYAPSHLVGSTLTIGNSIGFAITIGSLQLLSLSSSIVPPEYLFLPLALGPMAGLLASRRLLTAEG